MDNNHQDRAALLLWCSSQDKTPDQVAEAIYCYESKFGLRPNVCILHPAAVLDGEDEIHGLQVSTAPWVLATHVYVGLLNNNGDREHWLGEDKDAL